MGIGALADDDSMGGLTSDLEVVARGTEPVSMDINDGFQLRHLLRRISKVCQRAFYALVASIGQLDQFCCIVTFTHLLLHMATGQSRGANAVFRA